MTALRLAPLALVLPLLAGCGASSGDPAPSFGESFAHATQQPPPAAVRLEQAERSLDVGRDPQAARAAVEQALADLSLTAEQRDEARLTHSRALEATGDHEGAIAEIEGLLAVHAENSRWPLAEAAEGRLRLLLTGSESAPLPAPSDDGRGATPFARALTRYFPAPADGKQAREINILLFGGPDASKRLGTWDVAAALREQSREACPLCEARGNTHTSSSRFGSWVGLPAAQPRIATALTVFYYSLDDKIPARYDAELPLPSAEVASRLERGEGFVAVKERAGAPPLLLLAAPRAAQLEDVEEALAATKAVPTEPWIVPLKAALKPAEIQAVVRGSFGAFRQCYEALEKSDPSVSGRVKMSFAILGDGQVDALTTVADPALHDATFEGCLSAAFRALHFPVTHAATPTTVVYPIQFSPNG